MGDRLGIPGAVGFFVGVFIIIFFSTSAIIEIIISLLFDIKKVFKKI